MSTLTDTTARGQSGAVHGRGEPAARSGWSGTRWRWPSAASSRPGVRPRRSSTSPCSRRCSWSSSCTSSAARSPARTHDYLQFLLPGILAQTIATGAIAIGVNLNTDIAKGIFDRFRSLPIPRSAPLLGAVLGDVVRYVIVTVSTLAIGYLMGFRIDDRPVPGDRRVPARGAVRALPELAAGAAWR